MNRIVYGLLAVIASFVLAESLTCNQCSVGLLGTCLNSGEETCATNTSSCFTGRATFPSITDFLGFNTQGCLEGTNCNQTSNGTILGAVFEVSKVCCDTDNCNPVVISGAPSAMLSLPAAVSAAVVATVWRSILY